MEGTQSILALASTLRDSLTSKIDLDFYFAQCRYQFATDVFNKSIINVGSSDSLSDKIDSVLTHRYLGIPIFLALMWLMFVVVINVGAYPQGWLDTGFSMLGDWCSDVIEDEQLRSLVVDGVIGGVGSVLSFVPLIVLLYLFISLLEDTGYMARAAFLIDRAMRALGAARQVLYPHDPRLWAATYRASWPLVLWITKRPSGHDPGLPVHELRRPPARIHPAHRCFLRRFRPRRYSPLRHLPLGIVISICVALVLRHTTLKGNRNRSSWKCRRITFRP